MTASTAIAAAPAAVRPTPQRNGSLDALVRRGIETDLVRISTAGSVDDGKSTLIGRLLYDSKSVFTDHAANARKLTTSDTVKAAGQPLDYSLLVDGLAAEREQGITIDVAYRYFSTPRRRFIVADTPGHEQYTRNMATGASTADVAVILVDARKGVLVQSRRHAFIASLLGIRHVIVAVNKMDLVDWSSGVFAKIRADFRDFAVQLGIPDIRYVPVSALLGDNVVAPSANTPWYLGKPLLETLETLDVHAAGWSTAGEEPVGFRLPVQTVIRPDLDFRGFAGQVAAGTVKPGDRVTVLPSRRTSTVTRVIGPSGDLASAEAPQSVTLTLSDEVDISRGDMIVTGDEASLPAASRRFESMVVWFADVPLVERREYLLKHTTRTVKATVVNIRAGVDVNTGERRAAASVPLNGIASVVLQTAQPVFIDAYRRNRSTGAFILIDPETNATVGAGMVVTSLSRDTRALTPPPVARNLTVHRGEVSAADRAARSGVAPRTLWLTGLSGSGKSTIAYALEKRLFDEEIPVTVLDGDSVRHGLNRDLGFSDADRRENIRRVAEVARLMNEAGLVAIVSLISPLAADRALARDVIGADAFREIHVATPIDVCRARDPKGLYRKADAGEIAGFTGVSAPYEAPESPALRVDGTGDLAAWVARLRDVVTGG